MPADRGEVVPSPDSELISNKSTVRVIGNTAALVELSPVASEESIMHMTSRMKACARCRRQKVQDLLLDPGQLRYANPWLIVEM